MLCQCKCFYFLSGDQVRSSDWSNTSQWSFVAHVQTRSAHCQNILSRVLEFLMSRYWFVVEWNIPESLVLGQIRSWGQNRIRVSSSLSHKFETWYLEWETSTAAILFWHVHHWLHLGETWPTFLVSLPCQTMLRIVPELVKCSQKVRSFLRWEPLQHPCGDAFKA